MLHSLYITPPLPACDCREGRGVIYIGNTQSVSISFLFLFFFHQSSLYPIKIFENCFYLLVIIEVCVEQSIHLFSTSNVLLRRETVVTLTCMYLKIITVQIIMSKMFIPLTSLQSFYSFNKQTAIQICRFLQHFYGKTRLCVCALKLGSNTRQYREIIARLAGNMYYTKSLLRVVLLVVLLTYQLVQWLRMQYNSMESMV